jgi:SSS family solute:Na+ symporter
MINPFKAGGNEFTPWYFVIGILGLIFNRLSWQGTQAYNSSAKTPHEAKMAGVLSSFRQMAFLYSLVLIPLVAYLIMHHPEYTEQAKTVTEKLSPISNAQVRDQLLVPMTMLLYLPIGLVGAFVAVMFAADVSCNSTYLHSWSSIIVQDIIIPIRKKILSPQQHFKILRLSIICVAIYVSLFSCFFRQTQHIYYWFAMTGAIWLGGAGAVIIGGLYTTWGNTRGAYAALITGSLLACGGVVCEGLWNYSYHKPFILNGQQIYFFAMVLAIFSYIGFSLIGKKEKCDLNKILHVQNVERKKISLKEKFGITDEFTKGDKVIYGISIGNCLFFFFLWCVFTVLALLGLMNDARWVLYFKANMYLGLVLSFITAAWLTLGGIFGYVALRKDLKNIKIDVADDGTVFKEKKNDPVDDDQMITNIKK